MASRARATTVAERPGAGFALGLSSHPTMKPGFDNKRMSRDDMSVPRLRPSRAEYDNKRMSRDDLSIASRHFDVSSYKSYHIPIRGRLPSPETSPKHQPPQNITMVRTTTPDSLGDGADSNSFAIGMALGSPAHPPLPSWHNQGPSRSQTMPTSSSRPIHQGITTTNITSFGSPPGNQQEQVKSRKWGIFGRSKSKRVKAPEAAPAVSNTNPPKTLQKTSKYTPIVTHEPPVPSLSNSGRLLDIDIPDITLERYSVMFSGVLESQQPSSLLARRQANLDRLKTVKESPLEEKEKEKKMSKERERDTAAAEWPRPRIDTTRATRSPSFNLFPSTPGSSSFNGSNPNLTRLTPRARSKTSPGILPSPSKDSFSDSREPVDPSVKQKLAPWLADARTLSPSSASREFSNPNYRNRFHHPMGSTASLVSSTSSTPTTAEPDVHITDKLHPSFTEPKWQMVGQHHASKSAVSLSSVDSSHFRTKSTMSPEQLSVKPINQTPAPSITSDQGLSDDKAKKALEDAVQISIARQISVSQQQRKMLEPLQGSIRKKDPSPHGVGIATKITVGRKGSTPTMVHPPTDAVLSGGTKRKSSRGIVEAA
ncbi:hypothetical protein B0I35DRAFT_403545 [Stachybotrys elegans]|uniref:Uncharacterized protein n=1 Tax=Stachybotrys elegans TaxID=80388 RepID=A0A8K0WWF6_9HYPO|nr:hypothetical protein B0I35DRAFT_403545 [Stachybotrys elegans]